MKKISLLLLISVVSLWAVEFHSYKKALQIQKKTKKIIMIDIVRTGCHYCANMDKNTFGDAKFSKWIEKHFIGARINLDEEKLPSNMSVVITPTFYFIDTKGKILKKIAGSWNITDFKDLTENIH
jgi:thioredoxin-related protein